MTNVIATTGLNLAKLAFQANTVTLESVQRILTRHINGNTGEPAVSNLEEVAIGFMCNLTIVMCIDDLKAGCNASFCGGCYMHKVLMSYSRMV